MIRGPIRRTWLLPVALTLACTDAGAPGMEEGLRRASTAADTGGSLTLAQANEEEEEGLIPVRDISLPAGQYLEIDWLDALFQADEDNARDANLCSAFSTHLPYCPAVYDPLDNPHFPGPDPADPFNSDDREFIDWADLDWERHFRPFEDLDVSGTGDDIFKPDSCYRIEGNSPSKANYTIQGFAANDTWLYHYLERDTNKGNVEYHAYYTQNPPRLGALAGCPEDTWLWDMQPGDIEVTFFFQSTAGLPDGSVSIRQWNGPSLTGIGAEELVQSAHWTDLNTDGLAWGAINVAPGGKASPGEDTEYFIDPDFDPDDPDSEASLVPIPSGIVGEMAVDMSIFGSGCGLRRTVSSISTASGGGGRNDSLFDFVAPVTIVSGEIQADLTVHEACDERFHYEVAVTVEGVNGDGEVELPHDDIDVTLSYSCDDGSSDSFTSPALPLPRGSIGVPVNAQTTCQVTVTISGKDGFSGCDTELSKSVKVYPELKAEGTLTPTCEGYFSWTGSATGGLGPDHYSPLWDFTLTGGTGIASSDKFNGQSAVLQSANGPIGVTGTLTVTDGRTGTKLKDGEFVAETCSDDITPAAVDVLFPILVNLTPLIAENECPPEGDVTGVPFVASVSGGSGALSADWIASGDAELNPGCDPFADPLTQTCTFGLGDKFCAEGTLQLIVEDPLSDCPPASDLISASRTSKLQAFDGPLPNGEAEEE